MSVESRPIEPGETMSASEVRRRAGAGAVLLAIRGMAARIIGFAGNIALARLLVPQDFGLVAIGLAAYQFAGLMTDAGVGAALIRRPERPTRDELQSVLGFQLVGTGLFAAGTVLLALLLGQGALVVAVIAIALPLTAFKTPSVLLLERELVYRPLATVEILQLLAYYTWAVGTVALGFGIWGFASASFAGASVGAGFLIAAAPMRVVRPTLHWTHVKPLIGFGWQFQAPYAVRLSSLQALNFGIAAVAGVSTLGLWALAYRILRVPHLLFESLWRVSYPGMSRLIATGESPQPVVERSLCLVALAAGAMYVPLIGSAPALVPAAFGDNWQPVVSIVPTASLGLMVGAPISVAAAGYLYAIGDAALILRASVIQSIVWLGLGVPLLIPMGIGALGVAWLVSSLVNAAILSRAVKSRLGVGLISPLAIPMTTGIAAAAGGWILASRSTASLALAAEVAALTELLFWAGIAATQRPVMTEFLRIGRRSLRSAVIGPSR